MKKQIIRIVCVAALLCVALFCAACDEGGNTVITDPPTVETPGRDTVNEGFAGTYPPDGSASQPPVTEESESATESEPPAGKDYIVNFLSDGGTEVERQIIRENCLVEKPADPTKTDYIFAGWYYGEEAWDFENDVVTQDISLTAKWNPITYTVTFDSKGGTAVESQTVVKGGLVSKPANPTKSGFTFHAWLYNGEFWKFETGTVTEDITLTALWNEITDETTHTVSFYSDGGSDVPSQQVKHGEYAVKPEDPTRTGYSFEGWYLGSTRWSFETRAITESVQLTAKWKEVPVEEVDVPPEVPSAPILTLGTVNSLLMTTLQTPPSYSDTTVVKQTYFDLSGKVTTKDLVIKMNDRAYTAFQKMAQQFNRDTRGSTVSNDTGDLLVVDEGTAGTLVSLRVKTLRDLGTINGRYALEESGISASSSHQRVKNTAEWLSRHAATYGFVKESSQKYRYVGAGIALALQARNTDAGTSIGLNAYLAEIAATYKANGLHLTVTTNDGAVYEIWYAEPESGKVKLPTGKDMDLVAYESGYIVSVKTH